MNFKYAINNWLLDDNSSSLIHLKSGEQRRLGEYQLRLLKVLAENSGKILSRDALNTLVWERRVIGNNSLPNAIHALRAALDDNGKQQMVIRTIPRKGYILDERYCQRLIQRLIRPQTEVLTDNSVAGGLSTIESPVINNLAPLSNSPSLASQAHEMLSSFKSFQVKNSVWRYLFFLQLLIVTLLIALLLPTIDNDQPRYVEQYKNKWSHIQLFKLQHHLTGAFDPPRDLSDLIEPALLRLNKQAVAHSVKIKIYYFAENRNIILNVKLKSPCVTNDLVINISNWQSSSSRLNQFLYDQIEKSINEMENCHT